MSYHLIRIELLYIIIMMNIFNIYKNEYIYIYNYDHPENINSENIFRNKHVIECTFLNMKYFTITHHRL